jgi:hypothetical protein
VEAATLPADFWTEAVLPEAALTETFVFLRIFGEAGAAVSSWIFLLRFFVAGSFPPLQ